MYTTIYHKDWSFQLNGVQPSGAGYIVGCESISLLIVPFNKLFEAILKNVINIKTQLGGADVAAITDVCRRIVDDAQVVDRIEETTWISQFARAIARVDNKTPQRGLHGREWPAKIGDVLQSRVQWCRQGSDEIT